MRKIWMAALLLAAFALGVNYSERRGEDISSIMSELGGRSADFVQNRLRSVPDTLWGTVAREALEKDFPEIIRAIKRMAGDLRGYFSGLHALHGAAERGNREIADLLIEAGFDIDAIDEHGRTPLVVATEAGLADMVQFLLERGADADVTLPSGTRLVDLWAASEDTDLRALARTRMTR